jgi:septation ring formation regulator EzrA
MNTNTIEQELTIEERIKDLNELVMSGRTMEAFEKYYHEDVEMQENDSPAMVGKTANRLREQEFLNNVEDFRPAVNAVATAGDVSFVVWSYDYSHKEWGVKKYTQVSVQRWKNGKIIHEQFFYNG